MPNLKLLLPLILLLSSCAAYRFQSNIDNDYPQYIDKIITLTPDDTKNQGAVMWWKSQWKPPFQVSFEYSIWDDDGDVKNLWNSADGIVMMFCKNKKDYPTPPSGGMRGFVEDGTGYGVHIATYGYDRGMLLKNGKGVTLDSYPENEVYTDGNWRKVTVEVGENKIRVRLDGDLALFWEGEIDDEYGGFGFGAGTGGADSEHRLRNIVVSKMKDE